MTKLNLDDITIGEAKELTKIFGGDSKGNEKDIFSKYKGDYCIFRSINSGVFFGLLGDRDKIAKEVVIRNCRRIWSWEGAFTMSKIAESGVICAKLSVEEPEKLLSELIEIIPASDKCIEQLKNMVSHNE